MLWWSVVVEGLPRLLGCGGAPALGLLRVVGLVVVGFEGSNLLDG